MSPVPEGSSAPRIAGVPAVSGVDATQKLMSIELRWTPVGWDVVLDHYRVEGRRVDRGTESTPEQRDWHVLARTIFPTFTLSGLAPSGETWAFRVVVIDAAGNTSGASAEVVAESGGSATAGRPLAVLGQFDQKSLEFKYAPDGYKDIPKAHADGQVTAPAGATASDVPYLLPGPIDKWAGNKEYGLTWEVDLPAMTRDVTLALWLIDTTSKGGTLNVTIGSFTQDIELPRGKTKGSRLGDASGADGGGLATAALEIPLPADAVKQGSNTVELRITAGGWVAWDALGLFEAPGAAG